MGMEQLSDEELEFVANDQLDKLSTGALEIVASDQSETKGKPSSFMDRFFAFSSGLSGAAPPVKMAKGITSLLGLPDKSSEVEEASPGSAKTGKVIGEGIVAIPQYLAGMGALGRIKSGKPVLNAILRMLKGGAVNTAIGQIDRGKEFDPTATAIEVLTGAGGEGASSAVSLLSRRFGKGSVNLMNRSIGTTLKQAEKDKDIGAELIERGVSGTKEGLKSKAGSQLEKNEARLQDLLEKSSSTRGINKNIVLKELKNLKEEYLKPGWEHFSKPIDDLIKQLSNNPKYNFMNASKANELKRFIYKKLGESAYLADRLPGFKESQKALARGLRKAVEDVVPEAGAINKELRIYGTLEKAMKKLLDKENIQPGKFSVIMDMMKLLGLTGAGFGLGGPVGAGAAALVGGAATTTLGKTFAARGMNLMSKIFGKTAGIPRLITPSVAGMIREGKKP